MKSLLTIIFILFGLFIAGYCQDYGQPIEEPEPTSKPPLSGVGIRISSFGIPNDMLDMFLEEHPDFTGAAYCFEIRSYGDKGPQSVFSGVFGLEYSKTSGEGYWRIDKKDPRFSTNGEFSQLNITATILLNIFPKFPVNPYIGAGIGIGKLSYWWEGKYRDELGTEIKRTEEGSYVIPVGHIPIGVRVNILHKVEARIEGGFKNGFYFGACAVYYF